MIFVAKSLPTNPNCEALLDLKKLVVRSLLRNRSELLLS
jgi:hypothetical protein